MKPVRVAYLGKYRSGEDFDTLHVMTLQRSLARLGEELGIPLSIETYDLRDFAGAAEAHQMIAGNAEVAVVIDNTWGEDLRAASATLRQQRVPVVSLNADMPGVDTLGRVVFLGHDDQVPASLASVVASEIEGLDAKPIVCVVLEETYALSAETLAQVSARLGEHADVREIRLPRPTVEYESLLRASIELERIARSARSTYFVLCVHAEWGERLIPFIDATFSGASIFTGAFGVRGLRLSIFGQRGRGNRLIVQTFPADLMSLRLHEQRIELEALRPDLFGGSRFNVPLYLQRCSNAIRVVGWGLGSGHLGQSDPTALRERLLLSFRDLAEGAVLAGETSLLRFDPELGLVRSSLMEATEDASSSAYKFQIAENGLVRPALRFGIELASVSEIDPSRGTFGAELFYWIAGDIADDRGRVRRVDRADLELIRFPGLVEAKYKDVAALRPDRIVMKLAGVFSARFDLSRYPLDVHRLNVEVSIEKDDRFRPVLDRTVFRVQEGGILARGWTVHDSIETVEIDERGSYGVGAAEASPTFNLRVRVGRAFVGPQLAVVVPLLVLGGCVVLVSALVRDVARMRELCLAVFIGIIAFGMTFYTVKPATNVVTIVDWLYFGTLWVVLVRLVLAEVELSVAGGLTALFGSWLRFVWALSCVCYVAFILVAPMVV